MDQIRHSDDHGFDRLQRLLLAMKSGDELCPTAAARQTGLSEAVCRAVFEGLERAGLMTQDADDRFVRRSLDPRHL